MTSDWITSGTGADSVRCPAGAKPATEAAIPPGLYSASVTRADAQERGLAWAEVVHDDPDPKALKAQTREVRLRFTEQGGYMVYDVQLDGAAVIGWEGTYSVFRDRVTVKGNDGDTVTARVAIDGDRLRFTEVKPGPEGHYALAWGAKPFVRIDG